MMKPNTQVTVFEGKKRLGAYIGCIMPLLLFASCAMDHIPATSITNDVSSIQHTIETCTWASLPEAVHSLPSKVSLHNEVHAITGTHDSFLQYWVSIDSDTKNFLKTGMNGAVYYSHTHVHNELDKIHGQWLGWKDSSTIPQLSKLLPDEEGFVQLQSDSSMQFEAEWNSNQNPRGLAFVLSGLGRKERQYSTNIMMRELLEDGWVVVHIFTVSHSPKYASKIKLSSTSNPTQRAHEIIRLFDSKFNQLIGVTQAVHALMEHEVSALTGTPVVVIGISAGALNVPAIYYAMQDQIDAVVLIAGGANMFRIVQTGVFTKWTFTDSNGTTLDETELKEIEDVFLDTPSLDPYHLAPMLPHDRTLLIHAKYDAAVPANTGDLLWERAGKPQRWIFNGGHLGLFVTFSWRGDDIAQWISEKTVRH